MILKPESSGRKRSNRLCFPIAGAQQNVLSAEPGKRMRGTGRTGHRNPRRKPPTAAKAQDMLAHPPLSAEQMRHSAEVEPHPIRRADRGKRGPAPGGEHRELLQN